jgi:hypothetical protein
VIHNDITKRLQYIPNGSPIKHRAHQKGLAQFTAPLGINYLRYFLSESRVIHFIFELACSLLPRWLVGLFFALVALVSLGCA